MDRVRRIPFIAALLLAVILTGCGGEEPVTHESQAITIDSEGTVLCEFVEDFSEDYYDVEELKNMVSAEIAGFNSDRLRDDAAELVETEKKDGSVRMSIKFATTSDFMEFNDCLLVYDSVSSARDSGYTFSGDLKDREGNRITSDELAKLQNAHVVICDAAYTVETPYDIKFRSGGINLTGKHTAVPDAGVKLPMVLILSK